MCKKGFLACICVLSVLAMGTIVVHATASVDEQSDVAKEDCSKTELKGTLVPIGWEKTRLEIFLHQRW